MSEFKQIILYGSSMGGFGALTFAEACPGATVIAFNPQSTLHPNLVPWETRYPEGTMQNWSGDFVDARFGAACAKAVYVAYDPLLDLDYKHIDRLDGANLIRFKMPLVGHVMAGWMHEAGVLSKFLDEALAGSLTELRCHQLARKRRSAPRYYLVMGLRTRSSKVALACARNLMKFALNQQHQRDFQALTLAHDIWDCLSDSHAKATFAKFENSILFTILKTASDCGLVGPAWEICDYVISQRDVNWQILVLAAECLHRLSRLSEGKAYAQRAVAEAPLIGNCYRILARIEFDAGETHNACEAGKQGVSVDPNNFLGWFDLIKYHEILGQWELALACARKSLTINPNDRSLLRKIGTLRERLGCP